MSQNHNVRQHYIDYYGAGEDSFDRIRAIDSFAKYATSTGLRPLDFVMHVHDLDPTRGVPVDEQICMTTIFRTKGLEYDYVVIPKCEEGYMPCLYATGSPAYDTSGEVAEPEPSEAIENERRLFYVGITRAKKCLFIGASARPQEGFLTKNQLISRFLEEIQVDSVLPIMTALTAFAGGDETARDNLNSSVRRYGGVKWVRHELMSDYLMNVEDKSILGEVAEAMRAQPEQPFAYKHAYPSIGRRGLTEALDDEEDLPF